MAAVHLRQVWPFPAKEMAESRPATTRRHGRKQHHAASWPRLIRRETGSEIGGNGLPLRRAALHPGNRWRRKRGNGYGKPFDTDVENAWCQGCGNFGILNAVKKALEKLGRETHEIVFVSGIGQAAEAAPLHERERVQRPARPGAAGGHGDQDVQPRDSRSSVTSGDGDTYGEGGNHFSAHAAQRRHHAVRPRQPGLRPHQGAGLPHHAMRDGPARSTGPASSPDRFRRWQSPSPWVAGSWRGGTPPTWNSRRT